MQKLRNLINGIDLTDAQIVADLGCGIGRISLMLAERIKRDQLTAHIYSIDVMQNKLERLISDAKRQGLHNITTLWGDLERLGGTKLKSNSVDVAIMANVLFQLKQREAFVRELRRVLKPTGKLTVIDWQDSFGHLGPHPDSVATEENVIDFFKYLNFELLDQQSFGEHHYVLTFLAPNYER